MTLGFDLPPCSPSFVQRVDPRWKLAAIVLASALYTPLHTVEPAVAALMGSAMLVACARLPWPWVARRLGIALTMFVVFLVWRPFVVERGDETLELGILTMSWTGVLHLIVLAAKLAAMIAMMLVLVATTPLPHLLKSARAIGAPRLLITLVLLTYRYVFLLMEEFSRLRVALRARGFRNRADLHSYRTVGQVAGALLVRGHDRSERVGQAMRCRGFEGQFHSLDTFHTSMSDVLFFVIVAGHGAAVSCWDLIAWQMR